jgi:multiple sugar transport system permease protein
VDPLVIGAAEADDDGGLVPDLAPDAGGGVGLGLHDILGNSLQAIIGLMIADIWKTTPFVAIIVLASLVMLPGDIYEAAEVDGSSGWSTFWRITVPLLRPTLAIAVLFRVLQAFGLFDLPFVMTNGGPGTATTSLGHPGL